MKPSRAAPLGHSVVPARAPAVAHPSTPELHYRLNNFENELPADHPSGFPARESEMEIVSMGS